MRLLWLWQFIYVIQYQTRIIIIRCELNLSFDRMQLRHSHHTITRVDSTCSHNHICLSREVIQQTIQVCHRIKSRCYNWVSPSLPSRAAAAELWFCNHHFSLTERNDTFSQYCLIADCGDLQLLKADFIGGNGATGGWGRAIMNEKMSCLAMTTLGKSLLQEKGGAPGRDDWVVGNEANQNNSIEYFNGGVECSSEMTIAGNWHASFMLPACHIRYTGLRHVTGYMLYTHLHNGHGYHTLPLWKTQCRSMYELLHHGTVIQLLSLSAEPNSMRDIISYPLPKGWYNMRWRCRDVRVR